VVEALLAEMRARLAQDEGVRGVRHNHLSSAARNFSLRIADLTG
jgi:hypothetical protein